MHDPISVLAKNRVWTIKVRMWFGGRERHNLSENLPKHVKSSRTWQGPPGSLRGKSWANDRLPVNLGLKQAAQRHHLWYSLPLHLQWQSCKRSAEEIIQFGYTRPISSPLRLDEIPCIDNPDLVATRTRLVRYRSSVSDIGRCWRSIGRNGYFFFRHLTILR